jgi:hypothetical protein
VEEEPWSECHPLSFSRTADHRQTAEAERTVE